MRDALRAVSGHNEETTPLTQCRRRDVAPCYFPGPDDTNDVLGESVAVLHQKLTMMVVPNGPARFLKLCAIKKYCIE